MFSVFVVFVASIIIFKTKQIRNTNGTICVPNAMDALTGHPTSITDKFMPNRCVIACAAGLTKSPISPMTRLIPINPMPMVMPDRNALENFCPRISPRMVMISGITTDEPKSKMYCKTLIVFLPFFFLYSNDFK